VSPTGSLLPPSPIKGSEADSFMWRLNLVSLGICLGKCLVKLRV
jgi:hypothetical protein